MDQTEFEHLYRDNWQAITGYALRRVDTPADAADLVSEVFTVAWRRQADVPDGDGARLWLFGVARMCLANHRRSGRRRLRLQSELTRSLLHDAVVPVPPDPADALVRQDDVARLRAAMARLTDDDHELLTLVGWDGLTPQQAATVLGIGSGTARVRLHRARQRLRALLDEELERPRPTGQMTVDGHPPVPVEERS